MAVNNQRPKRGPMGGGPVRGPVEKAKNFKGTFKKLLGYLAKFKFMIIVVIICAILSTIFNIVGPKILGNITTEIYSGVMKMIAGTGEIDFHAIENIVLILLGIYVISTAFSYIQSFVMVGVGQKFTYMLRKGISEKINRLPMKYFEDRKSVV